jgi:tRNA-specific 2-thiouridylase
VKDVNWLGDGLAPAPGMELEAKIRSLAPRAPAVIADVGDGGAVLELAAAADGVAPGQACVFYAGTRVLGGGWIRRDPAVGDGEDAALDLTRADA